MSKLTAETLAQMIEEMRIGAAWMSVGIADSILASPQFAAHNADVWQDGWHEHYLEWAQQREDPTHPITKNNPYGEPS